MVERDRIARARASLTYFFPLLCFDESSQFHGDSYTGVPDGMGAYLIDDDTLRVIVQSESYGPVTRYETWPYPTNKDSGLATFTGSHVQYTDFDRLGLSNFMLHDGPASDIIKGFGQVATTYYNLAGEIEMEYELPSNLLRVMKRSSRIFTLFPFSR